jgi:formate--tetrahydrofolate ligase
MHGGVPKSDLSREDIPALERGMPNLLKHCENMKLYGPPITVCINRFTGDTQAEIDCLLARCREMGISAAVAEVWEKGGEGGLDLARMVLEAASTASEFEPLYRLDLPVKEKIECIATKIYGASRIIFTDEVDKKIAQIEGMGFGRLPICMAKTQYSLSDDPSLLGRPEGFKITVKDIKVSAGAGFIVAYTGSIMTMPGLPKHPAAERIDVDANGRITGLF